MRFKTIGNITKLVKGSDILIKFQRQLTPSCSFDVIQSVYVKGLDKLTREEKRQIKQAFRRYIGGGKVVLSQQNNDSKWAIKFLKMVGFKRSAKFQKVKTKSKYSSYGVGYFYKYQSIDH